MRSQRCFRFLYRGKYRRGCEVTGDVIGGRVGRVGEGKLLIGTL